MELKQFLLTLLPKVTGESDESLTAKLFKNGDDGKPTDELSDDALDIAETLFADHISKIAAEVPKAKHDEIHKEATFKALSKEEDYIRKTYGVDGKNMRELAAALAKKYEGSAKSDDAWMTDARTLKLQADKDEEIRTIQEQAEAKVLEATNNAERTVRFKEALPDIDAYLTKAGVDISQIKPGVRKAFLQLFEGHDFDKQEAGTFVKGPDGSLLKDRTQRPLTLEGFVSQYAGDYFPIQLQPKRESPGNDVPGDAPAPPKWDGKNLPKSQEEFNEIWGSMQPGQERTDFTVAYENSQRAA